MPRPGPPQPPVLKTDLFGVENNGIIEVNTSNSYELSWKIPEDNGVPIDFFLLQYYPVRRHLWSFKKVRRVILTIPKVRKEGTNSWVRVGDITKKEIPHRGNVRDRLDLQFQDTYYKIVLQAHNQLGYSPKSSIIIKTKKGIKCKSDLINHLKHSRVKSFHSITILDESRGGSVIAPPSMLNSVQRIRSNLTHHLLLIVPLLYCFGLSTFT